MPRTSRTARATRAAAAVCPTAPSLLLLPLMLGALLAGLWLLGAAPASADLGTDSLLRGGPSAAGTSAGGSSGTEETPDRTALDTASLGLRDSAPLDDVVPERIAEPVASTLGTVHHHLERGARRTAAGTAAVLPEAAWPVGEVREGARRVVEELDRTGRGTAGDVLAPVTAAVAGTPPEPLRDGAGSDRLRPEPSRDGDDAAPESDTPRGTVQHHGHRVHAGTDTADGAPSRADAAERHDTGAPATGAPVQQLSTGSASSSGGCAPVPAVAGYLTTAPVTAPASDAVLLAAHVLHPVPGGPSDDPTFSPD